ncbi:hypothetical protein DB29_02466 [Shouchella clausii]|nr:hypothetical protein DB29_02466 [Shouchella clausii]
MAPVWGERIHHLTELLSAKTMPNKSKSLRKTGANPMCNRAAPVFSSG